MCCGSRGGGAGLGTGLGARMLSMVKSEPPPTEPPPLEDGAESLDAGGDEEEATPAPGGG